jgi:hypothetical protein
VVVDLLDYDVRFDQGFLFSPRPVCSEVLETGSGGAVTQSAAADPVLAALPGG